MKKDTSEQKKESAGKPSSVNIKAAEDFKLAKNTKVKDYKKWKSEKKLDSIIDLIRNRFSERYLTPMANIKKGEKSEEKSGFCMMAISCLTIEAMESFRQGWKDTKGKSECAFCLFFDRYGAFSKLRGHCHDFYRNVRCGILHQAETTGGWRIQRDKNKEVFDETTLIINANAFIKALEESLKKYCEDLKKEKWDSELWINAIKKIDAICDNCQTRKA